MTKRKISKEAGVRNIPKKEKHERHKNMKENKLHLNKHHNAKHKLDKEMHILH